MEFIRIANFISIKADPKKVLEKLIYLDNYIDFYEDRNYRLKKIEQIDKKYIVQFKFYNEKESCTFEVHIEENKSRTERIDIIIFQEKGNDVDIHNGVEPIEEAIEY